MCLDLCRLTIEAGLEAIVSLIRLDMMGSLSTERLRYKAEMPPWLSGPRTNGIVSLAQRPWWQHGETSLQPRNATMAFLSPGPMALCHWPEGHGGNPGCRDTIPCNI